MFILTAGYALVLDMRGFARSAFSHEVAPRRRSALGGDFFGVILEADQLAAAAQGGARFGGAGQQQADERENESGRHERAP